MDKTKPMPEVKKRKGKYLYQMWNTSSLSKDSIWSDIIAVCLYEEVVKLVSYCAQQAEKIKELEEENREGMRLIARLSSDSKNPSKTKEKSND